MTARRHTWRSDFTAEAFLERRIVQEDRSRFGFVFEGTTDPVKRKNRIRKAIVELGLADCIAGNVRGKPETFRASFERLYGEPLRQP